MRYIILTLLAATLAGCGGGNAPQYPMVKDKTHAFYSLSGTYDGKPIPATYRLEIWAYRESNQINENYCNVAFVLIIRDTATNKVPVADWLIHAGQWSDGDIRIFDTNQPGLEMPLPVSEDGFPVKVRFLGKLDGKDAEFDGVRIAED